MIKYFQKKYAMSREGATNFLKAIVSHTFVNISFMLPVILSFMFLQQYIYILLGKTPEFNFTMLHYGLFTLLFFVIMYIIALIDYDNTYTKIYGESAKKRIELAETLRKLPLSYFGLKDVADLSATIMSDVTMIETIFSHAMPQAYSSGISTLIIITMLLFYNWRMTLALCWVVPFSYLIFYFSKKKQRQLHKAGFVKGRELIDEIQEGLDLVQELKSYNKEESYLDDINKKLDEMENIKIEGELKIGVYLNGAHSFLKLGMVSVVIFGAYLLSNNTIDIFTYIVYLIMSCSIYNPIMSLINNMAVLIFIDTIIERIREIDDMPRQEGKTEFNPKSYDIEFKNVDFSYETGIQTLKNVSLIAKQGEITALVGPSGGGKTTVAKLSARFWDINSGIITLGGEDISKIDPETLLKNYSIVFQDVVLFNSSIMENIRLGKKDATDEEVKRVSKIARCEEFINKLPAGYDTLIGENGAKLSGGERQRISIARALLKDSPIILMDEATASLDAENETLIQEALSELIKDKTVLIIAHRMRTIIDADKIIVIKDGEVQECGRADELIEKGGIFSKMYKTQIS